MKEALFYKKLEGKQVQCHLCPHCCIVNDGELGKCRVRKNEGGVLIAKTYGKIAAINLDPIEKKPLYRFYPGRRILSVGSVGCNFSCAFCQNWHISQVDYDNYPQNEVTPEQLAATAQEAFDNLGVAYTYNEPTIWYEYILECARLIHQAGLKNVLVSNGYINPAPLRELLPWIDAFSIDLKAFTDDFYQNLADGTIEPVKRSLKQIKDGEKHLEVVNLIIPGRNDDTEVFTEMVKWIANELGSDVPLHLSRYFPCYKMKVPPTPVETLEILSEIAANYLNYVYLGNV